MKEYEFGKITNPKMYNFECSIRIKTIIPRLQITDIEHEPSDLDQ